MIVSEETLMTMLISILDDLNKYSSLILILVTIAYVLLTWGMVREMRRTREGEHTPQLVATLIPFGRMYVKLRIYNTGHGPAMNIEAVIRLEPADDIGSALWVHPALLSGAYEDFRLPGTDFELEKLASKYDRIVVRLRWMNAFKRVQNDTYEFDLKKQLSGWSTVSMLVQPEDIRLQLGKIREELSKISKHFEKIDNDHIRSELLAEYNRDRSIWRQFWQAIAKPFRKIFHL